MKKIYLIPLRVLIGIVIFFIGYFGGLTVYFYAHSFYLDYAYSVIEEELGNQSADGAGY